LNQLGRRVVRVGLHLRRQLEAAGDEFGAGELVGTGASARDYVGDARPEREQIVLFGRRQPSWREAAEVQLRSEAVAGPIEVVAGGGRPRARIEAEDQHAQPGRDHVRNRPAGGPVVNMCDWISRTTGPDING
jgi:hypothetical protein